MQKMTLIALRFVCSLFFVSDENAFKKIKIKLSAIFFQNIKKKIVPKNFEVFFKKREKKNEKKK